MRLRRLKNTLEILKSRYIVEESDSLKGKWKNVFNNDNPIYVEIGMGKGKFIIENALKYPNINFIGIEKFDIVLSRAIKKLDNLDIPNLKIIRKDALDLEKTFDHEIDLLYLNFSDPWPKKKHAKRRLTSEVFLKIYDNIFKNECVIFQKTDNMKLFEYSLEQLSKYGYKIRNVSLDLHSGDEYIITTEYEELFMNKNMPIYRLEAYKNIVNKNNV